MAVGLLNVKTESISFPQNYILNVTCFIHKKDIKYVIQTAEVPTQHNINITLLRHNYLFRYC